MQVSKRNENTLFVPSKYRLGTLIASREALQGSSALQKPFSELASRKKYFVSEQDRSLGFSPRLSRSQKRVGYIPPESVYGRGLIHAVSRCARIRDTQVPAVGFASKSITFVRNQIVFVIYKLAG